ncbi:MAG TPA: fluoride efflux transporter CrcB [Mycobacteriales bacterium]|nr:fluoride efflux transporter CrcB [Mycobacteriales bacterium]
MTVTILVGVAAGAGAVFRYLLDRLIQHQHASTFPFGTLTINVLGSFVLGLTTGLATHHGLSARTADVIGIGICGGFTTWSTYCWETIALAESNELAQSVVNVAASLTAGLLAAAAGLGLALL